MIATAERDALIDFGVEALAEAGAIALRYFRTPLEVINKAKKRDYDPVTQADREVETCIRGRIRARFPDHAIIGEEFGTDAGSASRCWLIDPIDGTRGFISGTPMWGILLGLLEAERGLAGFVRQPFVQETYAACAGTGYMLDGAGRRTPLATRATRELDAAILCCTHPEMFRSEREQRAFAAVEQASRFSRYGTDCYGYCLLARGFVDLVVEADLEAYDVVPLIPIVEAAGGVITDWHGGPATRGGAIVAAATPELHAAAVRLLRAAD